MADETGVGRVEFRDGTAVEMPDDALMRIAYAMTTLALTPVIQHVHVAAIVTSTGTLLWPGSVERTGTPD